MSVDDKKTEDYIMSTDNEKTSNNQYLLYNEKDDTKIIISYRTNVIKEVQQHLAQSNNLKIKNFSSESITDEKFKKFLIYAKEFGYSVYKLEKL